MRTSLYFCQGSSDKEYHCQLVEVKGGWYVVNFQYGRRGSALKSGTKTPDSLPKEAAQKIYEKLVKEKKSDGYTEGDSKGPTETAVMSKTAEISDFLPQLLNPIEDPELFINDNSYIAQEKMDGHRRIVTFDGEITQCNRKGQVIPTITNLKSAIKKHCTLDGEMVGEEYYVFDLLSVDGKDIRNLPLKERLGLLSKMSFGKGIIIVKTALTKKEKRELFEKIKSDKKEGVVFKRIDSIYSQGRPSSGGDQLKFKFYKTATFIVSNMTKGKRSVGLELLSEGGDKVKMGKVTIPPNYDIPSVGDLVEVRYLYAYKGGAVFQPTYLGVRTDLDDEAANMSQIVYKSEIEEDE